MRFVVVSSYHPTSNRNEDLVLIHTSPLYLLIILHQTATTVKHTLHGFGCIFLSSYIKPQLGCLCLRFYCVVSSYHPTSNRNKPGTLRHYVTLYLLIILHQTATLLMPRYKSFRCIFLSSYIKPQPFPIYPRAA